MAGVNRRRQPTEILRCLVVLEHLEEFDNIFCVYCGKVLEIDKVHIDHKNPTSKGGGNESQNLCVPCKECNAGKGTKLSLNT